MFTRMKNKITKALFASSAITVASLSLMNNANATIVEFQTSQGTIQVNLFDQTTPETVSNFLGYVNDLHYSNSVIHRVVDDFVVQGGGYEFSGELPLTSKVSFNPIVNEPIYSNVAGTIAMAKIGNQPHSATDQWFFNLEDNNDTLNPFNLDLQNGGFTVFGQIIGDGMEVLRAIAELERCNDTGNGGMPISDADLCNGTPAITDLVIVEQVTIIDSSEATAQQLIPLLSKYPDSDGDGVNDSTDAFPSDPNKYKAEAEITDSDSGSSTIFSLIALSFLAIRKRIFNS